MNDQGKDTFSAPPRVFSDKEAEGRDERIKKIEEEEGWATQEYTDFYNKMYAVYLEFRDNQEDVIDELSDILREFDLSVFDRVIDEIEGRVNIEGREPLAAAFGLEKLGRMQKAFEEMEEVVIRAKSEIRKVKGEDRLSKNRMQALENIFGWFVKLDNRKKDFFNALTDLRKNLTIH